MRTYFDQNRLVSRTDRRFHATDIELAGWFAQIVPVVAARMTPQVRVGAWSFTATTLHQAEQIEAQRGRTAEVRNLREQRWWARQWRRCNGLYRVRQLSPAEGALAGRLLGRDGIPPECFPRAEGRLADNNDAQIIAVGGTLRLTSNMVMVRDGVLQEWFDRHHNEWSGVQARELAQRVNELFYRWWQHRRRIGGAHTNCSGGILAERCECLHRACTDTRRIGSGSNGAPPLPPVRAAGVRAQSARSRRGGADRGGAAESSALQSAGGSRAADHNRDPSVNRTVSRRNPYRRTRERALMLVEDQSAGQRGVADQHGSVPQRRRALGTDASPAHPSSRRPSRWRYVHAIVPGSNRDTQQLSGLRVGHCALGHGTPARPFIAKMTPPQLATRRRSLPSSVCSRAIAAPFFCFARRSSSSYWRLSQNRPVAPKKRNRRSAESPEMARLRTSVMRWTGTVIRRTSSVAFIPSASRHSRSVSSD